jgi:hypothetical protein
MTFCNPPFSQAWVESTIRNSNRRSFATSRCSHIIWTASRHASPVHHLTLTFSVWQFAHFGISHSGHISIVMLMPVARHVHCVLARRLGIGSVRCLLRPKARTTHTVPYVNVSFPSCRGYHRFSDAEYSGGARELTLPQEIGSIIDPVAASLVLLGSSAYNVSRKSSGENEAGECPQAKRAVQCRSLNTSISDMRLI